MSRVNDEPQRSWALRARWVCPIDRDPLPGGYVTLRGATIVAVGDRPESSDIEDWGDVIVLPGLINPHTHLEFSTLAEPLGAPGLAFPDWIERVIAWRQSRADEPREAIRRGWQECLASGSTTIGEIATGSAWRDLEPPPLGVTVFHESIGLSPQRLPAVLADAARFGPPVGSAWRPGLSPHAPYTVHGDLLAGLVTLARRRGWPRAMHLAESREELELLATGRGPLAELLERRGLDWRTSGIPVGSRPLDYLRRLARGGGPTLVVHGNYLTPDEIEFVGQQRERLTIVYCPRTHAYFGHEPFPLDAMIDAGARVVVGTDSRASNPDLNLWGELVHVANRGGGAPRRLLEWATLQAAEALGLAEQLGSLTPGKQADLIAVRPRGEASDPAESLLAAIPTIVRVVHRGRIVKIPTSWQ